MFIVPLMHVVHASAAQYRTMNRGGHSIYEEITKAGFEP